MKCPNCNGEINAGQNFCNHCGMPVPKNLSENNTKKSKKKNVKSSGKKPKKPGNSNKKKILFPIGIGALCLLVILAVGLVIAPKQTTAGRLQEKLDLGNNYLQKADYTKAKAAFKEALDIDEKSPEAALGMADAYNGEKNPKQAVKYLKKASENVKTASEKKDAKHVPQNAAAFKKHYQKSCNTTAKQYGNNTAKQQEVQKIIREFNTIVIYVPTEDTGSKGDKNTGKTSSSDSSEKSSETETDLYDLNDDNGADSAGKAVINPTSTDEITPTSTDDTGSDGITPTPTDDPGFDGITPTPTDDPELDGITPTPTDDPDSDRITPTPEENRIDVFKETVTPTPTTAPEEEKINVFEETVTPTPTPGEERINVFEEQNNNGEAGNSDSEDDPGFEIFNEQSQTFENYGSEDQNSYNTSQENGSTQQDNSWDQSNGMNQDSSWDQNSSADQNNNWNQDSSNENQNNENGENTDSADVQAAPEELLREYAQTLSGQRAAFSGTSVSYTDSSSANSALNGIVGIQEEDLNKDGIPELLVISMQNGRMSFTVYKVNNGVVEAGTSVTAVCDGTGTALLDVTYGCTQDCFIKDNGDSYIIGFASYVYGVDAGDGTTAARTSFEAYRIGADGTASLLTATTIQNGLSVYSNGDAGNAQAGGQDMFAGAVGTAGISGNWNASNASVLESMDLTNDPYQDMSGVPDPLSGGLSAQEGGVQDLVIVNGNMGAETGTLSFGLQDHTTFTN